MFSFKSIVLISVAFSVGVECSGVAPAIAAPLVAPAHVGYAHAVPQNIPPYASQVSVVNRAISPIVAGPAVAAYAAPVAPFAAPVAPLAAPVAPLSAPLAARYAPTAVAAPLAAAPYLAGSPVLPGPYAAPYAAPYPAAAYAAAPYSLPSPFAPAAYAAPYGYAASPLVRAPYGVAPAFVR